MASFRSPLGLTERLNRPDMTPDGLAIASVLITAVMLTLLVGSRFVFAPGVTVGLPTGETAALNLPQVNMGRLPGTATSDTLVILALKQDDMTIWNGRIRTVDQLAADLAPKAGSSEQRRGTLLLKADAAVSIGTFLRVVALARASGFTAVQIAAEEQS